MVGEILVCDSIGCMREAVHVRENKEGLESDYLCALCFCARITEKPSEAPLYRLIGPKTTTPHNLAAGAGP